VRLGGYGYSDWMVGSPPVLTKSSLSPQYTPTRRSLESLLSAEPHAPAERVITTIEDSPVQPPHACRCMNPECTELCRFPPKGSQGGRPQRFCSRSCRQTFDRVRARLLWEEEKLVAIAAREGTTKRQREALQREIGLRRWALMRYPAAE